MNPKRTSSRLLRSYMLSYLLIFLIPLILITVLVYQSAVKSLRTEIEQSNVNQLNQVRMTIDGRMKELSDIAARISYDNNLTSYMVKHPYYSREAINTLAQYRANSSIIDELFLYFHKDSMIYSSQGLSNLNVVFGRTYEFNNWTNAQITHDLNEINYPMTRLTEQLGTHSRQRSMLLHIVPIKPADAYPYASVVYLIEESKLTGMMDSILNDFKGNSYIFDNTGQVLTVNNHDQPVQNQELNTLSDLGEGIHSMMLNGKPQSVVAVTSAQNGWTYVTTMPSDQFFSRIFHIQTLIILVFGLIALAGIPIAVLLARRQYHPLRDLVEFAKEKTNHSTIPSVSSATSNEWTWIKNTLHDYRYQMDMQEPYVRHQCLLLLMKHGKPEDPETIRVIDSLGLEADHSQYFVMIVASDMLSEARYTDTLQATDTDMAETQRLEKLLDPYLFLPDILAEIDLPHLNAHIYGIEYSSGNRLALAVCWNQIEELERSQQMKQIVEAVREIVFEHYYTLPTVGVGTSYMRLDELNQSFIEAATAMEYRLTDTQHSVTYFDQLNSEADRPSGEHYWITNESLLKLSQSLKQGNIMVASHMVQTVVADVRSQALPLSLMRCVLFDLLNTVLKAASEVGLIRSIRDMPKLASFERTEELEEQLHLLVARICTCAEHKEETKQLSMMDQVLAYVREQYCDYALSLEGVAQQFSISSSYLSRTFKEKTGHTFSQYVWQLRMDEVIRQMNDTNDPLKDIILRVGYLDTANFIRKFKKETGCTPGQYRKQSLQNEDHNLPINNSTG